MWQESVGYCATKAEPQRRAISIFDGHFFKHFSLEKLFLTVRERLDQPGPRDIFKILAPIRVVIYYCFRDYNFSECLGLGSTCL